MKKSFLYTFVVLSVFAIFVLQFSIPIVEAQSLITNNSSDESTIVKKAETGELSFIPALLAGYAAYKMSSPTSPTPTNPQTAGSQDGTLTNALQWLVMSALMNGSSFVAWLVEFVGKLFDFVLFYTTKFPENLKDGINGSWKIVRDFSNIVLVFSLLYLGIKTILDGQGFADKKILVGIIIAAIAINFSLILVRDVAFNISNTVGLQVLQQSGSQNANGAQYSPSAQLMHMVNPQQVLNANGFTGTWESYNVVINDRTGWDLIFKMMGQFIMFTSIVLILAFIFVGVSVMLLYRFVIFIILMIASPIGLISTQIPWLKKYGADWFNQLKKQTLFFPAFTIILYIVLLIVTSLATSTSQSVSTSDITAIFAFLFNFVLVISFMLLLLFLPGKIGAAGSDLMTSAGNWTTKKIKNLPQSSRQYVGGKAANVVAKTGRLVGGGLSNKIGLAGEKNKDKLKALKLQARETGWRGSLARQRLRTAENLKDRTYDIRNTKFGGSLGIGKGIESWNAAVKAKAEKMDDKKKKEEKLFGLDKAGKDSTGKAKIAEAKAVRDNQGEEVKQIRENLKTAKARGATSAEIKAITDNLEAAENRLEEAEKEVGKTMNAGDSMFLEILKTRQGRWTSLKRKFSVTQRAALQKIEEDMNKKWKEAGKYNEDEKKKTPATPAPTSTLRTPVVSTFVPPATPPVLPPPTGL